MQFFGLFGLVGICAGHNNIFRRSIARCNDFDNLEVPSLITLNDINLLRFLNSGIKFYHFPSTMSDLKLISSVLTSKTCSNFFIKI